MHLKILHLWFGPTTPPINTGCSQKRLTGGESVLPLWDTDAYGTWSGGPGGDKRGRVGWSCLFFFFEYETWGEIKKKKKGSRRTSQSWAAGRWSELAGAPLNTAPAKKPSRKTFSGWLPAESKSYTPPWSLNQNRVREKQTNHSHSPPPDCLLHTGVCAVGVCGCSCVWLCVCLWECTHLCWRAEKTQRKRAGYTSTVTLSRGEGRRGGGWIPPEQNRPAGHVAYQIKPVYASVCVSACVWVRPYGFVTKICLQPTKHKKLVPNFSLASPPPLPPPLQPSMDFDLKTRKREPWQGFGEEVASQERP